MILWLERAISLLPGLEALAVMALRSVALVALGWLGALLLKRALPASRQALWATVVVGLVLLPLLTATLPAWRVLPYATEVAADPAPRIAPVEISTLRVDGSVPPDATVSAEESPARLRWADWTVLAWALGAGLSAGIFLAGLWRLRRVRLEAEEADDESRSLARAVARDFGVRRRVSLRVSSLIASPATWGLRRPVILIPACASGWSAERLHLVLAHEMAHIARGDWVWRLIAHAGCALYWFNPLAWVAARRLRFEQELACDLTVVDRGARPSLYAHHLLDIARAATRGRALPLVALDMARQSQMEGRLMSILADRSARRLRRGLLLPALSMAAALPVVAAIQPQAPVAPETPVPPAAAAPESPASPESLPASEAPVTPAVAPTPTATAAPPATPRAAAAPAPRVAPPAQLEGPVAPTPVVAPAPVPDPEPSSAPVYGILAARGVKAPVASVENPEVESDAPVVPMATEDRARARELEERIAAKAAEIEELVAPIHSELERAMSEEMGDMQRELERLHLEIEPLSEEMSRIGDEMSRRMMETMPAQLEVEEYSRKAEAIAREIEERARLTAEMLESDAIDSEAREERIRRMQEEIGPQREKLAELHREMAESRRSMVDMEELMAPYRAEMEALRERMAPQRERMEELRRQFEPRREEIERLREERMSEIRSRLEALQAELRELSRERAAMERQRIRERRED